MATGERKEKHERDDDGRDNAAVALGRKGGKARAERLMKKRRVEIAS